MDPVTAIGFAASILTFIDFSWNVVTGTYEVYKSTSGATIENASIAAVISDLRGVTESLGTDVDASTKHGKALLQLAKNCSALSDDLSKILKKLQVTGKNKTWQSLKVKLASMRREKEVVSIGRRLDEYRSQIVLRLNLMLKYVCSFLPLVTWLIVLVSDQHSSIKYQLDRIEKEGLRLSAESATQFSLVRMGLNDMTEGTSVSGNQTNDAERSELANVTGPLAELRSNLSRLSALAESLPRENHILRLLYFDSMYSREDTVADAEARTYAWLLKDDDELVCSADSTSNGQSLILAEEDPQSHSSNQLNADNRLDEGESQSEPEATVSNAVRDEAPEYDSTSVSPEASLAISQDRKSLDASVQTDCTSRMYKYLAGRASRMYARKTFLEWLALGRGVYHISGKAGAGKSTLMKFLFQHSRTRSKLSEWALQKKLVLVDCFFWSSGDHLQRSLEGLYRSILFEVLKQCPELIPEVFPDQWARSSTHCDTGERRSFRLSEIKAAFNLLIQKPNYTSHRFCFFLDGVDEYEGDSVQHWELARDIATWASSEDVKICVSSRPHVEFMETFSSDTGHRIRLHQLTAPDIRHYAESMFEKDANFARVSHTYLELVDEIVENADGVFLWAVLVVRSLLDAVGHHASLAVLRTRLKTMPRDLGALFETLLGRINPSDRMRADKMFLLTVFAWGVAKSSGANALIYTWLDDLEDPIFPFSSPVRDYHDEEVKRRHDELRAQLDGVSRGLLELRPAKDSSNTSAFYEYTVQFFHRTVRAYFQESAKQIELESQFPDFHLPTEYCRLRLAEFKFAQKGPHDLQGFRDSALFRILSVCSDVLSREKGIEQALSIKILESFDSAVESHKQLSCSFTSQQDKSAGILSWAHTWSSNMQCDLRSADMSYIHFLAARGFHESVVPKVRENKGLLKSQGALNLLLSATIHYSVANLQPQMVRLLLENGADPNEAIQSVAQPGEQVVSGTVWLFFLVKLVERMLGDEGRGWYSNEQSNFTLVEHFLRFGADRIVYFVVYPDSAVYGRWPYNMKAEPLRNELFYLSLGQFVRLGKAPNMESIHGLLQETGFAHFWTRARQTISLSTIWNSATTPAVSAYKPYEEESLSTRLYNLHSVCSRSVQLRPGFGIRVW